MLGFSGLIVVVMFFYSTKELVRPEPESNFESVEQLEGVWIRKDNDFRISDISVIEVISKDEGYLVYHSNQDELEQITKIKIINGRLGLLVDNFVYYQFTGELDENGVLVLVDQFSNTLVFARGEKVS